MTPTSVLLAAAIAVAAVDPEQLGGWGWVQPAGLAVLAFLAATRSIRYGGPFVPRGPFLWIGAWLAWSAIGAALSSSPGTALIIVASFAAVAIAGIDLVHNNRNQVVGVFGLAAVFSVGAAVLAMIVGNDGGFSGRLQLLFLEPNQLARAAAVVLVTLTTTVIHRFGRSAGYASLAPLAAGSILSAAALFLTQSRTGVAAAAVGLLIVVTAQLSRRLCVAALVSVALLLTGGAIAVLSGSAGESINQSLSRSASAPTDELRTLNGRTVLWPEVVDVAMERPITGVGLGLDRAAIAPFRAEGRVVWSAQHTHSLPLQLWLTTGVPGVLLLGAGLVSAAVSAWRRPHSLDRTLALGLLGVIVVDGIVEPVLRVPSFAWLGLIVSASLIQTPRSS